MKLQTILITTLAISSLHAQNRAAGVDPFGSKGGNAPSKDSTEAVSSRNRNISLCYEAFSLPLATAANYQREQLSDSELYARLTEAVEKKTAIQETFAIVRTRSGERCTTEGISEIIYATEFDPPKLPEQVGVALSPKIEKDVPTSLPDPSKLDEALPFSGISGLRTPATPTAFETRNTGVTVEAEMTLSEDGREVSLLIAPEHVSQVGTISWGQELSICEMPVFEAQKLSASGAVRINQPFLLGTANRPPNSKLNPDSASRVWFAYITVTLPKP